MTENHASEEATIKGHNLRLAKMMTWTHTNYPAYFRQGVVKLTRAQISDAPKYYKCTHDFLYNKINVDIVKAFISSGKVKATKEDGEEIYYSYDHLRKYKDAVLFGAKRQKVKLGDNFKVQMEAFMDSLKKENQKAKKNGQCTEQEADPITFPLYREICRKAIATGNIFLWVFTVCQWNCMARSINIDNLRFNCLSLGKDSLVVKYWDTKKDKKGEKHPQKTVMQIHLSMKSVYIQHLVLTSVFTTKILLVDRRQHFSYQMEARRDQHLINIVINSQYYSKVCRVY